MEFQIGMRVKHIDEDSDMAWLTGTIVDVYSSSRQIGVEWDESKPYMHNCNGKCKSGHGYYVLSKVIKVLDEEGTFTSHTEGGESVKLEDLDVALPLLGLRVMVKPEHFSDVEKPFRGISGTIVNNGGSYSTTKNIIKKYKNGEGLQNWSVGVKFDNGKNLSIRINKLLPIANGHKKLYEVNFISGDIFVWTEEEYKQKMNNQIIMYQNKIIQNILFDDDHRQKLLDEA